MPLTIPAVVDNHPTSIKLRLKTGEISPTPVSGKQEVKPFISLQGNRMHSAAGTQFIDLCNNQGLGEN